ncbi:hypothetical protein PG993_011909 [Apiospora rasikravindrae]|uniref:BTB domain-containing protein n=1 Tax=Apiospora rasikravindrae TaxID=990691 RepID=A0ABR1S1F0_9PEZI
MKNFHFEDSYEEHLQSGKMSDVQLSCGDRTWNLHKIVLCRSPFFKKAFTGGFKEANESHMTLEDTDPQDLNGVISYIYTGKISSDLKKDESIEAYIRIFELGDFFDLRELRAFALVNLEDEMIDIARSVNEIMKGGVDASTGFPEKLSVFSRFAQLAYGTDSHTYADLRKCFLYFFAATGMKALHLGCITEILDKIPGMAVHILTAFVDKDSPVGKYLLQNPPTSCCNCGVCLETFQCLQADEYHTSHSHSTKVNVHSKSITPGTQAVSTTRLSILKSFYVPKPSYKA